MRHAKSNEWAYSVMAANDVSRVRVVECGFKDFEGDQLGNRIGDADVEPQFADAGSLADGIHQLAVGGEDLVRVGHDELAGFREDLVAAAALKEFYSQRFFEQADLRADRWLRDVEIGAGLRPAHDHDTTLIPIPSR